MKKDTLYLIIAALTLYITWRMFRMNKKKTETQVKAAGKINLGLADPAVENEVISVTLEDCPYCGTHNAQITRWRDAAGNVVRMEVACPNKGCPGTWKPSIDETVEPKSEKFVKVK